MRTHSRSFRQRKSSVQRSRASRQSRRSSHRQRPRSVAHNPSNCTQADRSDGSGFLAAWRELVGLKALPSVAARGGRRPRVGLASLLAALVFHVMHSSGTLSEHFHLRFEDALSDSACSDRRARLPCQIFAELMERLLRPLARKRRHPEAFWRGWLLTAMDGTQHSVTNTPQNSVLRKAKSRRGRAAFAKISTSVLLELGLHNPLAA